ncbi:MAG: hypothetical protein ACR650_10530 [Methylocystis sp.]
MANNAKPARPRRVSLGDSDVVALGLERSFWVDLHHHAVTALVDLLRRGCSDLRPF